VLKVVETTTSTIVEDVLTEVTNVVIVTVRRRYTIVLNYYVVRLVKST